MSKILTKKLMYIIVVIAVLAMMIPMSVPVSAAGSLSIYLLDPVLANPAAPSTTGLTLDSGFNITGSMIRVVPVGTDNVTAWAITNYAQPMPGHADAQITASALGPVGTAYADILTGYGPLSIVATLSDGTSVHVDKKTTQIDHTTLTAPENVVVVWNEGLKTFSASATATDSVSGIFTSKDGTLEPMPIQGAILHWYLVAGDQSVSMTPGMFSAVNSAISALPRATFTTLSTGGTTVVTVTGANGQNSVNMTAIGQEYIKIVIVPEYPNLTNVLVTPEVASINFWTSEMEKVPQVRWAGEKIVLEKYFGPAYAGQMVRFSLENQSPGALEGLQGTQLGNLNNTAQTVWDVVSTGTDEGWARCMLVSEDQGEVDVDLALYSEDGSSIENQHGFVVFYMKMESITLGNVIGKRAGHNIGDWTPANPWDPNGTYVNPATPDVTTEILNVSQDALLRARVKGWFMGDNMSSRAASVIDMDLTTPGVYLETLPAGRWILPDDWAILAGPNWKAQRIHWDIMDAPNDNVKTKVNNPLGPYYNGLVLVAANPVIGPFRPGLEVPISTGYNPNINTTMANTYDDYLNTPNTLWAGQKTVVPNGALDVWDAPMPPAKITFQIQDASVTSDDLSVKSGFEIGDAGFFKDAMKTGIYYLGTGANKVYTAPFYQEMIPAFRFIPPFVNNGGYDWNSWTANYGPYQFWDIFNRPPNLALDTTTRSDVARDNANFPAEAQVYSDNHGEAMIYLNGNYNLNPDLFTFKGLDIPFGSTVGSTTVSAITDYPYFRKHNQLVSAIVTKTWTWGGMVLGPTDSTDRMILSVGDYTLFSPGSADGFSNDKMVWVWATDRDGLQAGVLGTTVDWAIDQGVLIAPVSVAGDGTNGVSTFNATMKSIGLTNGFLNGTSGVLTGSLDGSMGRSTMKNPSQAEKDLFNKFWGEGGTNEIRGADGKFLNPANFVVAAIDLLDTTRTKDPTVTAILKGPDFGTLAYYTNVNFASSYPLDDNILPGDANLDGKVNMADVTAIERIILGLASSSIQADANANDKINMGDVVKTERIILGID